MRAIQVPAPGVLVLGDVSDPVAGDGEVIVRVHAAGVNRADLMQAAGKYPPPPGASEILGLEVSGEVEGTGERVMALLPGGGYAERVAVPRSMLLPMPEGMSYVDAAGIPEVFTTAYLDLFVEAELQPGERVLVHAAASGVGTAAIQLARRHGCTVVGLTRSPEKCDPVRLLGADLALFVADGRFAEHVTAAYGERSIDVILDPVGAATLSQDVRLLAPQGRIVFIATMSGGHAEVDLHAVVMRRLRLVGSTLRARPLDEKVALMEGLKREVLPGFRDRSLRVLVDSVFPLADAADAHRRMASNENIGKIVLDVANSQ
jgi:putative PIG3 family NAD(P)H quinone oxidoreductase